MILIVLFALFFGIIALRFITDHGDYVKVPDLKGKTLDSVAIDLDKLLTHINENPKHFFAPFGKSSKKIKKDLKKLRN